MTLSALAFLILAIVILWGGLAMAIVFYRRSGASGGEPPRNQSGEPSWPRDT